jgi:hypothetical protein
MYRVVALTLSRTLLAFGAIVNAASRGGLLMAVRPRHLWHSWVSGMMIADAWRKHPLSWGSADANSVPHEQ